MLCYPLGICVSSCVYKEMNMNWYKKAAFGKMEPGEIWEDANGNIMYIKGNPNSPLTYWQFREAVKMKPVSVTVEKDGDKITFIAPFRKRENNL